MNIEGKNPVKELLSSGAEIDKIIIMDGTSDQELRQIQKLAHDRQIRVEFADKRLLDKIKVKIYKNPRADFTDIYSEENDPESGELVAEAESDTLAYPGAYTVKLDEPVELEQNQVFSAVAELTNGAKIRVVTEYEKTDGKYPANDMTFSNAGDGWTNTRLKGSHVAQIKVFTKNEALSDEEYKGNSLKYADIRFDRRSVPYDSQNPPHPDLTVYFDGKELTEGEDYTVEYPDTTGLGLFYAAVTGIGEYDGTRKTDYFVRKASAPPNKPERYMEVTGNYETYKDIPLPENWVWGEPDTEFVSGRTTWIIYKGDDADCYENNMADISVTLKNE